MELAVFTGTAVLILVQPAQEVVSSSRVASLNVIWSFCFIFPPFFSNSTGWGHWGNQEAKEVQKPARPSQQWPSTNASSHIASSHIASSHIASSHIASSHIASSHIASSHIASSHIAPYWLCSSRLYRMLYWRQLQDGLGLLL